jgi:ATP-dependent protease Clp ATPase subunit
VADLNCSFCGKSPKEVRKIITKDWGMVVANICDECLSKSTTIIAESNDLTDSEQTKWDAYRSFYKKLYGGKEAQNDDQKKLP